MSAEQLHLSASQTLTVLGSSDEALELESTWAPAMTDRPPRHWHPRQTESFEVLEGELTVELGGASPRIVGVGGLLEIPPRTAHRMWNAGTVTTRALWTITPAMRSKEMFAHIARGRSAVRDVQLIVQFRDEYRLGSPRG